MTILLRNGKSTLYTIQDFLSMSVNSKHAKDALKK